MKILILEDERALSNSIIDYLTVVGHVCEVAYDFSTAIEKIELYEYDCFIVDINLPDGNGLDVIKRIKEKRLVAGIIIISARDSIENRVEGIEIGADHYLNKPFHLAELSAYIKSVNRRINFEGDNSIVFNEIKVLPDDYRVFIHENEIELTKKEFELLQFFLANKNRIISKSGIAEHLWGDNIDCSDSFDFIYSHIKNLRKKMLNAGSQNYIQTVHGIGYQFKIN